MMSCNKRNKGTLELPFEIIVEILSWLPVKSLLRFKCLCKQWCTLIQDYNFILQNMARTSTMLVYYPCKSHYETFEFVSSHAGLCMEKSSSKPAVFRIRNPATHQVLYLPDPPLSTVSLGFAFNSSTGECKVICFYTKWLRLTIHGVELAAFGFKVLTIGSDEQWRPLELPDRNKPREETFVRLLHYKVLQVEGICHLVQTIRFTDREEDMYLEIQTVDLWTEQITTNSLPRGVSLDWNQVRAFRWNNCLSVGYLKESSLHLWVLKNYKEQKWSPKMIIIPIKSPTDYKERQRNPKTIILPLRSTLKLIIEGNPKRIIFPLKSIIDGRPKQVKDTTKLSELDLHISDEGNYRLSYVKKDEKIAAKWRETAVLLHKPSLISFGGIMMPEDANYPMNEGE